MVLKLMVEHTVSLIQDSLQKLNLFLLWGVSYSMN